MTYRDLTHPDPVPVADDVNAYAYPDADLRDDRDPWLDRIAAALFAMRWRAYSQPYPNGRLLGYAWTRNGVLRKARRNASRVGEVWM
jgi:hypothetical protein